MKKLQLIFASVLLVITSATATSTASKDDSSNDLRITKRYRYTQPIMFVERGVEFLIFPNGEFDFNTEIVHRPFGDNVYYRQNSRRNAINNTYGAPGVRVNYTRPRGVLVLHDRFGRVRRIGNTFINYDRRGRIKRAGSVYMQYKHGRLKRVGGLTIQYNRFGDMIGTHGFVNYSNQNCGVCGVSGCTTDHFQNNWENNGYHDDWGDYDDDYYYYRKGDKKIKRKKIKNKKRYKYDD